MINQITDVIFKLRDVIFEEGVVHITKQSMSTMFTEKNNSSYYISCDSPNQGEINTTNIDTKKDLLALPILL